MLLALAALPVFPTLVVTHHSDVISGRVLGRAFAPVERVVHGRSAMVFSTSEAYIAGSDVLRRLGTKVRPLPFGLDLAPLFEPTAAALRWESRLRGEMGSPLWLAVGRLVYYKGLATAIDALAHLPGRLLVVGTGPLERDLRARAAEQGTADRISWVGYAEPDKLVGAYRAATALWFPSNARSEGYGLVQVEAMASGCPVINTAVPHSGVSWVSRHGETGLTIPVGDKDALVAASRRLLDEPGLRDRLAAGGRSPRPAGVRRHAHGAAQPRALRPGNGCLVRWLVAAPRPRAQPPARASDRGGRAPLNHRVAERCREIGTRDDVGPNHDEAPAGLGRPPPAAHPGTRRRDLQFASLAPRLRVPRDRVPARASHTGDRAAAHLRAIGSAPVEHRVPPAHEARDRWARPAPRRRASRWPRSGSSRCRSHIRVRTA